MKVKIHRIKNWRIDLHTCYKSWFTGYKKIGHNNKVSIIGFGFYSIWFWKCN